MKGIRKSIDRTCAIHGEGPHAIEKDGHVRCRKCASAAVIKRRRKAKEILAEERGGKCELCGYNKYIGALEFHHKDEKQKSFAISNALTRGIDKSREEAKKCVLICANCHREVHNGITTIPG